MNKFQYKFLTIGDKFLFEGREFVKTNHQRGYYMENGRKVFRNFRKSNVIETGKNKYDVETSNAI